MTHYSALSTEHFKKLKFLGPWRTACQWLSTLLVIIVPFVRIGGDSLLRLDFTTLTLHVAGTVLPIEALWLFLLFCLAMILLFLLVTLAFGRAWCGWACPQTTLVDLVEWCARKIGVKVSAGKLPASTRQRLLLQLLYLFLALLVGTNLVWYFVSPYVFFAQLTGGTLHWAAWVLLGFTAAVVYTDLALLRRLFCKEFCPYGRFQTVLVDPGTLTLRYHPDEAPRCIRCGACVRACPTGIDIRNGYQIECINCGRCLDACREVMARRRQGGIIRYTFGLEGRGVRALLNPRTALVAAALLAVAGILAVAAGERAPLALKVARNATLMPRPADTGQAINFFTLHLVNRERLPQPVLIVATADGFPLELRGPAQPIILEGNEKRRIDIGLVASLGKLPLPATLELQTTDGHLLASEQLLLLAPPAAPTAPD
ncbi:MAG: 4Fe-4S binding protein [Desulfuromonas sp.]|nr:4Fe-4S binding protein [Desulfuromonas sp.]